jgi:hypothetical protein
MQIVKRGRFDLALYAHTAADVDQDEWDRACAELSKLESRLDLDRCRALIITDGGGPNMRQRAQLFGGVLQSVGIRSAAISNALAHPLKRGLVKAVTWANPSFIGVGPEQWRQALAHIGLDDDTAIFGEPFAELERVVGAPLATLTNLRRLTR